MTTVSIGNVLCFLASVALQIIMLTLMPLSKGYTILLPTLGAMLASNTAMWLFARIIASGVQLSILIPISATVTPLTVIAIGVLVYGEPAPALKIVLLVSAASLVGIASSLR